VKTRRQPWWIPHFLGRVPAEIDDASLRLLGAVALALLFEEYDQAMVTAALKQIAAELGMVERDLGLYLALIRLGALPAFALIPLADRIGRRPVFVFATAAMGVLTFATAFSQSPLQFVILQALTRTFFVAGSAVAFVIVTEEFPAAHRGWGIGMLAALGAIGHGLGAAAFSQIERLPYGWRALYVFGIVPVLMIPWFLRRIPETKRFTREAEASAARSGAAKAATIGLADMFTPLRALAMTHPARAAGVAVTAFVAAIATLPSFQFSGYYTQTKLGWEPGQYAILVIAGGAIGIIGNIVAGRLGDLWGRKRVGFALLAVFPLASFGFYQGPVWAVIVAWVVLVFTMMGGRVILRSLATELFPTSQRGAASGMFAVLETLGAVAGLLAIWAYRVDDVSELAMAVPLVSFVIWAAALVLVRFPETNQRELEDIS
jgi:MFS transporter, putative metabolite:H+ symporter